MTKLRVQCPKCNSNARFYRQRTRKAGGEFPHDLVLECSTCGFRSYSEKAFAIIEKHRIAQVERDLKIARNLKIAQDQEARRIAKQKQQAEYEAARILAMTCAWSQCDKSKRPSSKYCSRFCSNKNARYQYSQRLAVA